MKKLLFTFLLIASINLYAQIQVNPEPSKNPVTKPQPQLENIKSYNRELFYFLTKSNDLKIQLSAYGSFYNQNPVLSEMKKALKTAITPSSDKYTLYLANSLCHNNKNLTDWCHKQHIHEAHRNIDPENVYTYILDLNENKDIDKISQLLKEISDKTTYSNSFFFENILQMANQIESFNNQHPLLFKKYASKDFKASIKDIHELQLVEKGIVPDTFETHFNENTSIINAVGIEMARITPYKAITQACKESTNSQSCLHIGQLFMKSKTLLDKMIGNAIVGFVQKSLGQDEKSIIASKKAIDIMSQQQMCYAQINNVTYAQMYNKKFMIQYINDAKIKGELEAYKNLAYTVYNTEIKNGINPDFDPKDCE